MSLCLLDKWSLYCIKHIFSLCSSHRTQILSYIFINISWIRHSIFASEREGEAEKKYAACTNSNSIWNAYPNCIFYYLPKTIVSLYVHFERRQKGEKNVRRIVPYCMSIGKFVQQIIRFPFHNSNHKWYIFYRCCCCCWCSCHCSQNSSSYTPTFFTFLTLHKYNFKLFSVHNGYECVYMCLRLFANRTVVQCFNVYFRVF